MPLHNRDTLKNYFRKGQLPKEGHFNDLIDSMINKIDDGMSKSVDEGLMLSPVGESHKLLSFYKSMEDKHPSWQVEVHKEEGNLGFVNSSGEHSLLLNKEGRIAVGHSEPIATFDVNGVSASKGRMGTAFHGKFLADGNWHSIVPGLNGCHLFEVVAGVGKKKTGKYALLHAIASSTFGKSKSKIRTTQSFYGLRSNRISLRWKGDTYLYELQARTRSNYGKDIWVNYHITNLWHDMFMDNSIVAE